MKDSEVITLFIDYLRIKGHSDLFVDLWLDPEMLTLSSAILKTPEAIMHLQ